MKKLTLKELREKNKKNQEEISIVIGKSVSAYSMIENGKRKLSLEDATKISEYYCIPIEKIKIFKDDFNGTLNEKEAKVI